MELQGRFANEGENRVFFVPGNHDAPLLLDEVWKLVEKAVGAKAGRVFRCGPGSVAPCTTSGLWVSADGKVLIEHGHQIGEDVNRFSRWPNVVTERDATQYVERPWGQKFVQALFNAEEMQYPVIDNLMPESAGTRYRMAERGFWASAADVARFLRFNLFETSIAQKAGVLGGLSGNGDSTANSAELDLDAARALGDKLYLGALPKDDPFAERLRSNTKEAESVREELKKMLSDSTLVPDSEVKQLCDQMQALENGTCSSTLSAALEGALVPKKWILAEHLAKRKQTENLSNVQFFVYGHTHDFETGYEVNFDGSSVTVFNTGAFQRVVDEAGFKARADKKKITPEEALRVLRNEDLAPCYTAVFVALGDSPVGETIRWQKDEGNATGRFVPVTDPVCE